MKANHKRLSSLEAESKPLSESLVPTTISVYRASPEGPKRIRQIVLNPKRKAEVRKSSERQGS
jgi:hypothetical protein